MDVGVAQQRLLPPAEGVVRDGHRDRHVDADHPRLDVDGEVARGVAVGGEDRRPVAELGGVDDLDRLLVGVGAHDHQDGPEHLLAVHPQAAVHLVQDRRAQPEAVGVLLPRRAVAAPVEDHPCPRLLGVRDPLLDALERGARDDGPHLRLGIRSRPHDDLLGAGLDGGDQFLLDAADGDDHRQGHAALARRAEGPGADVLGGELDVRVRHDDRVVVGAAQGLDAFAVGRARVLDDVRHRRGADEADRVDAVVGEDLAHQRPVARDDVEEAVGQARLLVQAGDAERGGGHQGGDLEDEGVARGQRDRVHPHGDHDGEVEGGDARDHADRLAERVDVDARGRLVGELALERRVDPAREVDGLAPPGDLAQGVPVGLPPLAHDDVGQFVLVLDDELAELEHDVDALGQRRARPLGLGRARDPDDVVEVGGVRQAQFVDHRARRGILHGERAGRGRLVLAAVHPEFDCHCRTFRCVHP